MNATESDYPEIYEALSAAITRYADHVGVSDLEQYFVPLCQQNNPNAFLTRNGAFEPQPLKRQDMMEQFARSLQNSGQMLHSIMFDKTYEIGEERRRERRDFLSNLTQGFNPDSILSMCAEKIGQQPYDALYVKLFDGYSSRGWIDKNCTQEDVSHTNKPKTNMRKYAQGLYDAACFINDTLESSKQMKGFDLINHAIGITHGRGWTKEMETIPGMLQCHSKTQQGVHGLGPALARDFLKECGCLWLAKPDTHLIKVFEGLGLIELDIDRAKLTEARANKLCKVVYRFAEVTRDALEEPRITPYRIDKMIWLLCTGNFYLEDN